MRPFSGSKRSAAIQEEFEFRDVWLKPDPQARADAIALWRAHNALEKDVPIEERAKALCIAAYDGETLCALSTGFIHLMECVRTNMAFFRIFIAPEYRERRIAIPLTYATHDAMHRYATAHPRLRIGGTAASVNDPRHMDRPVLGAGMVFVGFNELGQHLLLKWFEDFRL